MDKPNPNRQLVKAMQLAAGQECQQALARAHVPFRNPADRRDIALGGVVGTLTTAIACHMSATGSTDSGLALAIVLDAVLPQVRAGFAAVFDEGLADQLLAEAVPAGQA